MGKTGGEYLLQAVNANNQITGLSYDAAGNQTNDGSGLTFTYDAENRIVSTGGVTYAYDGDGKRVKKDQTSGSTYDKLYWFGAGSDVLAETTLSGTAVQDFIFFGGKRIARLDVATGTIHYYFSDHLGSASVVTNATGSTIEEESDYYPWGRERVIVDLLPDQNYKFTGKERDLETGLDYFGARYYSSSFGRFLTPDWAAAPTAVPYADFGNPQSLNLYAYVKNNPLNATDPDGHCCVLDNIIRAAGGDPHNPAPTIVQMAIGAGKTLVNTVTSAVNLAANVSEGIQSGSLDPVKLQESSGPLPQLELSNKAQVSGSLIMTGAIMGAGLGVGEPSVGVPLVQQNRAQGLAFQGAVYAEKLATDAGAVQNVTLRTQNGVRTVMDVVSKDTTGSIVLTEAKSSATAPLTPNQAAAHPEIAQTGATVAGKGKPGYPGGTRISPSEVEVKRPK